MCVHARAHSRVCVCVGGERGSTAPIRNDKIVWRFNFNSYQESDAKPFFFRKQNELRLMVRYYTYIRF